MPIPVSLTVTATSPSIRSALNPDLALLGELDRVAGQIEQDLAEPHLVAHHRRQVLGEIDEQGQTLRRRLRRHAMAHFLNN